MFRTRWFTWAAHDWSFEISLDVVSDEWGVEDDREPFSGDEEEQIEEDVKDVLGQHQRVQAVALIDRVLVVGLQLIERNDVKNGEKDEKRVDD